MPPSSWFPARFPETVLSIPFGFHGERTTTVFSHSYSTGLYHLQGNRAIIVTPTASVIGSGNKHNGPLVTHNTSGQKKSARPASAPAHVPAHTPARAAPRVGTAGGRQPRPSCSVSCPLQLQKSVHLARVVGFYLSTKSY